MNRKRGARGGYLLPMVILGIVVSLIVGFSAYYVTFYEHRSSQNRLWREQAFYLADAAVERAFVNIRSNPLWQPEQTLYAWEPDRVLTPEYRQGAALYGTVTQTLGSTFKAVGQVKSQSEEVEVAFTRGGSFAQGLFGEEWVTLEENGRIDSYDSSLGPYGGANVGNSGDTCSMGVITLQNNAEVYGSLFVDGGTEELNLYQQAKLYGETHIYVDFPDVFKNMADVVVPSELASAPYPQYGDSRITVHSGSYTLNNGAFESRNNARFTFAASDYHFKSLELDNNVILNITGTTRMYIENFIKLDNNSQFIVPEGADLVIYLGNNATCQFHNNSILDNRTGRPKHVRLYTNSPNTISMYNNSQAINMLFYAPYAQVKLQQNAQFFGGIVAKQLYILQNGEVHYDNSLVNGPGDDPGASLGRLSMQWRKPRWVGIRP